MYSQRAYNPQYVQYLEHSFNYIVSLTSFSPVLDYSRHLEWVGLVRVYFPAGSVDGLEALSDRPWSSHVAAISARARPTVVLRCGVELLS